MRAKNLNFRNFRKMEIKISPTYQHVTWNVKAFLELPQKKGYFLDSPEFFFSGDRYCLRLHPKMNTTNGDNTAFHVRRLSVTFPERKVSCKVGFRKRDANGDECYYYSTLSLENNYLYPRREIERNRDYFVPDGSLTVECSIWLSEESSAGRSVRGEEERHGFPGHNASFSTQWISEKMELLTASPYTRVALTAPNILELIRETVDSVTSPEFRFAGDTYCFRLQADGDTDDRELQLVRLTSTSPERTVFYRFGHGWIDLREYMNNSLSLVGSVGSCVSRSKLEEIYKNEGFDYLFLELFLRLGGQSSAGFGTSDAAQKRTGLQGIHKLQSDYKQLLQERTATDACFVVRGKEFQVHRVVLRARSTVFEAMFGHDTAEKESGRVVVDDLDPDSFGDFLEYLYTGDVQDKLSDDNAVGLYVAADKYDVATLKSDCVEYMRRTLSVNSFCDVMTLALSHREDDLLQQAIGFFKENIQGIIITAKWQQFMRDNPTSANELLIKAIMPEK